MTLNPLLSSCLDAGLITPLDRRLADTLQRLAQTDNPWLLFPAILAERAIAAGHCCFDLQTLTGKPLAAMAFLNSRDDLPEPGPTPDTISTFSFPDWTDWLALLQNKPANLIFGDDHATTPFVRLDSRVYLRRYWRYERLVESKIRQLANATVTAPPAPTDDIDAILCRQLNPLQFSAVELAGQRRFMILSGGPGTGKTYTLAAIVIRMARQFAGHPWHIRLAAPTGKAAARMQASLASGLKSLLELGINIDQLHALPEAASTIHRLLGSLPDSPYFRHHAGNPLDLDLLIVDEASMIDLPLMAKLLDALPDRARLILVGDAAQLASVEPGRIFGDLCQAADADGPLAGTLCQLSESRRFPDSSPIGSVSRHIGAGAPDAAWEELNTPRPPVPREAEITLHPQPATGQPQPRLENDTDFKKLAKEALAPFLQAATPDEALQHIADFCVLTPQRRGPFGVAALNAAIERILTGWHGFSPSSGFYPRQIILITRNTPDIRLFNGDTGVIFPDPDNLNLLTAFFPRLAPDQPLHKIPLARLPECQTAFATTIHKAQGSEFNTVAMILLCPQDSPLLTRELLYTGITRTRHHLHLWTNRELFTTATQQHILRHSGLFMHPDNPS